MRPLLIPAFALGATVVATAGDASASAMPRAQQVAAARQPAFPQVQSQPSPVMAEPEVATPPEPQVATAPPEPPPAPEPGSEPSAASVEAAPPPVAVPPEPQVAAAEPEPPTVAVEPGSAAALPPPTLPASTGEADAAPAAQPEPAAASGAERQVAAVTPDAAVPPAPSGVPTQGIVGKALYGPDGVKIGTVKDVTFGGEGRAVAVVVGVGGFFGFGGRDVTVPLDRLRVAEGGRLATTLARDALDPP